MAEAQGYARVYCSSDWHNPPDKLKESVVAFLEQARKGQEDVEKQGKSVMVIGVGDLFDLTRHGWKAFISCQAIQELADELRGLKFVYVAGNHDPLPWIGKIMGAVDQRLKPIPHYGLRIDSQKYYFAHGHQWNAAARCLHLLTPLLIWLTSWSPVRRIVEWWMNRVNPTPGRIKQCMARLEMERDCQPRRSARWSRVNRRLESERERYNESIGWVHGGAGRHAETNGCVVICGHTHKPWRAHAFEGERSVPRLHDDGDLVDSCTYLVIEGGTATLRRLAGSCKPAKPKPESWLDKGAGWVLVIGSAGALLGVGTALLRIPISISTLLCRYPWLPGRIASLAGGLLGTGLLILVIGCVLDYLARKLRPSDWRTEA
jgi:UDP-2,3-diacylglucosamine pyrophosphatase LpxH